jgi:hypothetical protein
VYIANRNNIEYLLCSLTSLLRVHASDDQRYSPQLKTKEMKMRCLHQAIAKPRHIIHEPVFDSRGGLYKNFCLFRMWQRGILVGVTGFSRALFCPYSGRRVVRDSAVGIATRYGLDGPGSNPGRGRDFTHPSRPGLSSTQPPIQWIPALPRG